jgi:hypothetical protein
MGEWTPADRRIGLWSATSVVVLWVMYVTVGLVGVVVRPPSPNPLNQADPYLAMLEILMSLCAVALVVMMAAVYCYAPPDRKTHSLAALACMIVFVVLTCSVHFVSLTVGRQIEPKVVSALLSQQLSFEQWPTLALALDLLAWDFFLGLSLLFAAPVFKGDGPPNRVRISMIVAGMLCLAGVLGPALGQMHIQYLGIGGYAFVLPVACFLLAMLFRRSASF